MHKPLKCNDFLKCVKCALIYDLYMIYIKKQYKGDKCIDSVLLQNNTSHLVVSSIEQFL